MDVHEIPPEPPTKIEGGDFFSKLSLKKTSLERLSTIAALAGSRIHANTSTSSSIKGKKAQEIPREARIALTSLGKKYIERSALAVDKKEDSDTGVAAKEYTHEVHDAHLQELDDFDSEMLLLFGSSHEEFYKKINAQVEAIKELRVHQLALADRGENTSSIEIAIKGLTHSISVDLEQQCERSAEEEKVASGAKILANLLKGFKVRSLLNKASSTHDLLKDLHREVKREKEFYDNIAVQDPETRRQIYGNVKFLQERTRDLMEIESARKKNLPQKIIAKIQRPKLDREYQDLRKTVDDYYDKFNFKDDEVREYQALSLDAHRPKRIHLVQYSHDIIKGALNVADKEKRQLQGGLVKEFIVEASPPNLVPMLHGTEGSRMFKLLDKQRNLERHLESLQGSQVSDELLRKVQAQIEEAGQQISAILEENPEFKPAAEDYIRLMASSLNKPDMQNMSRAIELSGSPALKLRLEQFHKKMDLIGQFEEKTKGLFGYTLLHPHIGNNNLHEDLSFDQEEWKVQQELAKDAIQDMFNDLKTSYIHMAKGAGIMRHDLSANDAQKTASKILNNARDHVLADKGRWNKPIIREIEIPAGPLANQTGSKENLRFVHEMECLNKGYPSSADRGREIGLECIQPNLMRVQFRGEDGDALCAYSSSATNVEFFQEDDEKRAKATEQQTLEILLTKADSKLETLSDTEQTQGTKENPHHIDVPVTLLLSPDTLRGWIMQNPKVNEMLAHRNKTFEVDPSKLERRTLEESVKAWNSFDANDSQRKAGESEEFKVLDKEGNPRDVRVETDENGKTFVVMKSGDEEVYFQFDITCYNAGCNDWTKMMSNLKAGIGIEKVAKWGINATRFFGLKVGGEKISEYSGEKGFNLEDQMNDKAFAKQTEKYNAKMKDLKENRLALHDALKGNQTYHEVEEMSLKIAGLRKDLESAETAYHTTKSRRKGKLDKARKTAYQNWQVERDKLAKKLSSELIKAHDFPELQEYLHTVREEEDVRDAYNEVKDLLSYREYRLPAMMKRNMYTLPSAFVTLGIMLDGDPHTGCRSGKDRTSLQRMEIALRFGLREAYGRPLNYREIEEYPHTAILREQLLLNSGHIDNLAYLNTGSQGLNLSGSYGAYLKNFGRDGNAIPVWYEKVVLHGAKDVFAMKLK